MPQQLCIADYGLQINSSLLKLFWHLKSSVNRVCVALEVLCQQLAWHLRSYVRVCVALEVLC